MKEHEEEEEEELLKLFDNDKCTIIWVSSL